MSTASDPFRHLAVFFHDVDGLVATLAPMLTEALARGDLVWAAVDDPARGALERRLGSAADDVVFGEPAQPYSYSGQTTASRRADRLRELTADGRAALVLSDSSTVGGPGPRSSAPDFWSVVDASCNLALTGLPVTLVCLCDAAGASEDTERYLYWNHPELFDGSHASPEPALPHPGPGPRVRPRPARAPARAAEPPRDVRGRHRPARRPEGDAAARRGGRAERRAGRRARPRDRRAGEQQHRARSRPRHAVLVDPARPGRRPGPRRRAHDHHDARAPSPRRPLGPRTRRLARPAAQRRAALLDRRRRHPRPPGDQRRVTPG